MDYQSILGIVFVFLLSLFLYLKRDRLVVQKILHPIIYFVMYRTKLGIHSMDVIASKFGRSLKVISFIGIIVGFVGMIFISYELIGNTVKLFTSPDSVPGIKPVMPFAAKGVFFVPFLYWIISIFVIAIVHEFSHGMVSRAYNIPVKSSGFAFLGVVVPLIPAAFVEPDEKKLVKKSAIAQLSVFVAGPFSNIVCAGLLFLFVLFVINPVASSMLDFNGVKLVSLSAGGPAEKAGFVSGELIESVNNVSIKTVEAFTAVLSKKLPGDVLKVKTNVTERLVVLQQNPAIASKSFLGVSVSQGTQIKGEFKERFGNGGVAFIVWFFGLIYWLLLLNLGIGLFNLLPIGPVDGGRMLLLVLQKANPKNGVFAWKMISLFFMLLILGNLIVGFVK